MSDELIAELRTKWDTLICTGYAGEFKRQSLSNAEMQQLFSAASRANAAEGKLRRLREILTTKLKMEFWVGSLSDETQSAVILNMAEARELRQILGAP